MTDYDMKFMRDKYIRSTSNVSPYITKFINEIRPLIKVGEVWRLNTAGYSVVSFKHLTESKKKEAHPHLHYGNFYGDKITVNLESDNDRLERIDKAIDKHLRTIDVYGKPHFKFPINTIYGSDPEKMIDRVLIGEFRYKYKSDYVDNICKIITDGEVFFDNDIRATEDYHTCNVQIKDQSYVIAIIYSKDDKDFILDTSVGIYLV